MKKTNYSVVNGIDLPNIPWEGRSEGNNDVVWRSSKNPIIPRDAVKNSNSIFNSAVVPFEDGFAGVFRVDSRERWPRLHAGKSRNGVDWKIEDEPINFITDIPYKFEYGYDPRVCWIEDRFYVTWCNGFNGEPTIGMAWTRDFENFYQMENAFLPFNRNGVLFPRKINGKYAMLSRPSDNGHTPFGDIYYSESPDMCYWGKHRHVMSTTTGWQGTKIGAGPIPIETSAGWLIIYHGVLTSCNGMLYSAGSALLDINEPWKVLYRTKQYILAPHTLYECVGDVPNVVFPCAALCDASTGRLTIYYGGADTVVAMAHTYVDELIQFTIDNSY